MGILILPIGFVSLIFSFFVASYSLKFQRNYREKYKLKDNNLYFPISILIFLVGIAIGNYYVSSFESSGQSIFHNIDKLAVTILIFCISPVIGLLGGNISIFIKSKP